MSKENCLQSLSQDKENKSTYIRSSRLHSEFIFHKYHFHHWDFSSDSSILLWYKTLKHVKQYERTSTDDDRDFIDNHKCCFQCL